MMRRGHKWTALGVIFLSGLVVAGCGASKKPSVCRNPNYISAMKDQASSYYAKGNYVEALKTIKEAEACKPKDPEVYYWMGLIYFQREKYYEAIDSLKKSLDVDSKYTKSNMALGLVYLKLERWDDAIKEFETVTQDDFFDRPWEAYNNLGWAYLQKGELGMAEVNLKQSIHLNQNYCVAHSNLGELYIKQGDTAKAIESFQAAIGLCPENYARPHLMLAIEYGRLGYFDHACSELSAAAKMKNAPEAAQALEYMKLYNCPGIVTGPPGR